MTQKLDPTQSKCWTCKLGVCLRETEQQIISSLDGSVAPDETITDEWLRNMQDSFNGSQEEPLEHILEHSRVKTICFANPAENDEAVGILSGFVHECNRYEPKE